jgi:hypothetical protein
VHGLRGRHPDEEQLLNAVRTGGTYRRLDFTELQADRVQSTELAIKAWLELRQRPRSADQIRPSLLVVLQFLGLRAQRLAPTSGAPWQLDAERLGDPIVPAFGSAASSGFEVRLAWHLSPGVNELRRELSARAETPVLLLVFGTVSEETRARFAEAIRSEEGLPPVALIDTPAYLSVVAASETARARGAGSFGTTMKLALPCTAINPYTPYRAGAIAREMFVGRRWEISTILDPHGAAFVYGGRRLGKSALLHAARRDARRRPHHHTVYVDLKEHGIGHFSHPSAIVPLLLTEIARELKVPAPAPRKRQERDQLSDLVQGWLRERDERQLVVMLDESDEYFQTDARDGFAVTGFLRKLREDSGSRFKPVFAGLHQVKRFYDIPNQAIVQFGESIGVGPLTPAEAHELVVGKLGALGYRFQPAELAFRLFSTTLNHPGLLQLVCDALVREMLSQPRQVDSPPHVITEEILERVLTARWLVEEMAQRFELTINLDPRYRVIALVVAYSSGSEPSEGVGMREINRGCDEWWPQGFLGTTHQEFLALLGEMVDLGILYTRPNSGRYAIRTPSVRRALGTQASIESALYNTDDLRLPERFEASTFRERIGSREQRRRSPLTLQQSTKLSSGSQLIVVLGTHATGLDGLMSAIEALSVPDQREFREIRGSDAGIVRKDFLSQLRTVGRRKHKFVLAALSELPGELDELLDDAEDALARAREGTVCGILLTTPTVSLLETLARRTQVGTEASAPMVLQRWRRPGLRSWALQDDLPFQLDRQLADLLRVTGGWPSLVAEAMPPDPKRPRLDLDSIARRLAVPAGAEAFLRDVGLAPSEGNEAVMSAWRAMIDFGDPIPETSDFIDELAALIERESEEARLIHATLDALQLLDYDAERRLVALEAVAATAWRTVSGTD